MGIEWWSLEKVLTYFHSENDEYEWKWARNRFQIYISLFHHESKKKKERKKGQGGRQVCGKTRRNSYHIILYYTMHECHVTNSFLIPLPNPFIMHIEIIFGWLVLCRYVLSFIFLYFCWLHPSSLPVQWAIDMLVRVWLGLIEWKLR